MAAPGHRPPCVPRPRHVMAFTSMHAPAHLGPGEGGGGGEGEGGTGLGDVAVGQHWTLPAPGHRPARNGLPRQLNLLISAHAPGHFPGGAGVGAGVGDCLNAVVGGQHLTLLAPGHRPVWNTAPLQSNVLVSAHSPAHRDEGEGGRGEGGRGVGNTVLVGQHLMCAAPGHSPTRKSAPLHRRALLSAHSPLHAAGGGGGGGGGRFRCSRPVGQHLMLLPPGQKPDLTLAPTHRCVPVLTQMPGWPRRHARGAGGAGAAPCGQH